MELIDTSARSVDAAILQLRTYEANKAEAVFAKHGFEKQASGAWHHKASGLYAAVDDYAAPFGTRYAAVYAHRIINDQEVLAALVMIPWYGDGMIVDNATPLLDEMIRRLVCAE
jgi:hypothetical protein